MSTDSPALPELSYLPVFHAVCEAGGFTAAARRLRRSQPAISYQVRALEDLLGAPLFERGGRRLLLTAAGERLRASSVMVFGELARVRAAIAGGPRADFLRLGSASGFGRFVLMPALHALRARLGPQAPLLDVRFDHADIVLRNLDRGECDAAFVYSRRITRRQQYVPVYDEELVCIAGARQPRVPHDLRGFAAQPFVTYEESDYVFGRWFGDRFGKQPPSITSVAHFSELDEVVDMVRRGAGLSIVPRDSVRTLLRTRRVRLVNAGRREPCVNQIFMVTRSGSDPRPELASLAEELARADGQRAAKG